MLNQQQLKELLNYNSQTGIFHWVKHRRGLNTNLLAGGLTTDGYIQLWVNGKKYLAHRLAWLYVHGVWPKGDIDHKDTVKQLNVALCWDSLTSIY